MMRYAWFVFVSMPAVLQAAPHYAIIIGNNAVPPQTQEPLRELRYADDDAVRFYEFFTRMGASAVLLTTMDDATQKRYPTLAQQSLPPTLDNLQQTLTAMSKSLRQDIQQGQQPILYFVFSGHGSRTSKGTPFLALQDGMLTQKKLYRNVLGALPATFSHLIIDACNAGSVVGMRGGKFFAHEASARLVDVHDEVIVGAADKLKRFPTVGVLMATSADQQTHEWSHYESGVFTHEVLSALSGAADVNADRNIEYSEVQAFISAANRDIVDPRAIPTIIARAPTQDRSIPLVSLNTMHQPFQLSGDASSLGRFYIELANGQRYLDAHLGPYPASMYLPPNTKAFVRTEDQEAEIYGAPNTTYDLSALRLKPRSLDARGSIEAAFRRDLFASAFHPIYYRGFVDSQGLKSVSFAPIFNRTHIHPSPTVRRPWPFWSTALGGGAAVLTSAVLGGISLKARSDAQNTQLQQDAFTANQRHERYGIAAMAVGVSGLVSLAVSWWLWDSPPAP
ncbi:MAG: caspase family protein [Myxococcota bacterium]